ncbi:ABC transporter substrate-binding protein [Marinobacter sp. HL-58]|uniref:ABC transporter substrate-binding protein n=1 Tax=Marinobacter sp. HL-58 TaxID=1479237 RepID=UPI000481F3B6|nr:ABC transporter substrate-binding protein [Marinobacter sp. HL-58]KPQ00042.1 MAG: ABC-type uptake system substrate-binding component [Marinobacter sp. HL-58]
MDWLKRGLCIAMLALISGNALSAETVRMSLFSWPGYGFWFIAKEKNLAPDLDLEITIIEDPYESFSLMSADALDVTSSTAEYAPIAADKDVPVKMVTYTNPSYGTDKIVLAPGFETAEDLKGESVAVLEGGLTQIFMGIWLEENGVSINEVEFTNLIMDDAVGALVGGDVAAAEFWEPFGSQALEALPGSTVVASSEEPGWIETALLGDAMYMSDMFLEEKPETAAKVMQAYFDAVDYWKENPAEANKIIAEGLNFPISDVEKVLGKDGEIYKGGIWIFDKTQAGKYMGLVDGELPLGLPNGQITEHWETVTDWWVKFGLVDERHPMEAGVDMTPLKTILESDQ